MRKVIYTIAISLSSFAVANGQTAIRETRDNIADLFMAGGNLMVYTVKEQDGQYLYTERIGDKASFRKDPALNGGAVNSVIGASASGDELYVYQKTGRREGRIAIYRLVDGDFQKTGEKPFPTLRNHSYNLGAYLSPNQSTLLISADLGKTEGYDDLYLSKWENGGWSDPVGLGTPPNTREAEFAPFVANDSLFFSRKSGGEAFVFSLPMGGGSGPSGEPVRMGSRVNKENSFNSAYKRVGGAEMWITRGNDGTYTAFLNRPEPEPVVSPEPGPQPVVEATPEPAPTELTLSYDFNRVYMSGEEEAALDGFLSKQEDGATLLVKGYSDSKGPAKGRTNVARQRATLLRLYIGMKHGQRNFTVQTDSEVLDTEGPQGRKVELKVLK